jgi:phosphoesterase RecJ-like protein
MAAALGDDREQIVQRLLAADRLLIVTHARPDGDAVGATAALAAAARAAGKSARTLVPGGVPDRWAFLFPDARPAGTEDFPALADEADLIVVVDTCAFAQLDGLEGAVRARRDKVVVLDHHATRDDVGSVQWVDTSAAAAGVMVAELLGAMIWPVTPAVADALMTALTTDTGWLRFANTDGRCLRAAAKLLDSGVRPDELYSRLYEADRPERLRLLTRALASLRLEADGRIATMSLRGADFAETGARADETENFVNEALRIGCVEVAMLLAETGDCTRVSLRSRGAVDVSQVARAFGGGGHARAAGLRATEDIEALADRLVHASARALPDGTDE